MPTENKSKRLANVRAVSHSSPAGHASYRKPIASGWAARGDDSSKGRMIYAIKCGKWIKFGKANVVEQRLRELQIGNPYKLKLVAKAEWPDSEEHLIHEFLDPHHHQGEWFKDSISTRRVVEYMLNDAEGLALWRTIAVAEQLFRRGWTPPDERRRNLQTEAPSLSSVEGSVA